MSASCLGFINLDKTVEDFDEVTTYRIAIAHSEPFDEAALPTAKVWTLLCGMIRLYMRVKIHDGERRTLIDTGGREKKQLDRD